MERSPTRPIDRLNRSVAIGVRYSTGGAAYPLAIDDFVAPARFTAGLVAMPAAAQMRSRPRIRGTGRASQNRGVADALRIG